MKRFARNVSFYLGLLPFAISSCNNAAINAISSIASLSLEDSPWIGGRKIIFSYNYLEFGTTFLVGEGGVSHQKLDHNQLQIYAGVTNYQERFASWQESETEYFFFFKAFFDKSGKFVEREIHRLDGFLSDRERYLVSVHVEDRNDPMSKVDAEFAYCYTDTTDYSNIPLKEGYVAFLFSRPATVTEAFENEIENSPNPIRFSIDGDVLHYFIDYDALKLVSFEYGRALESRDSACH